MNRSMWGVAAMLMVVGGVSSHALAAPFLTVTPTNDSPGGGYLPLSLFGIAPSGLTGDDAVATYNVPAFTFAGELWDKLTLSTNGYLLVGPTSDLGGPVNQTLPSTAGPNNVLAPYWADLDPSRGGAIRIGTLTDGVKTWIVVDWSELLSFDTSSTATHSFEAWIGIGTTEDITYVYGTMPTSAGPRQVTVGAENKTGEYGGSYYYNGTGTLPIAGTQLRVTSTNIPVPEPTTLAALASTLVLLRRRRG